MLVDSNASFKGNLSSRTRNVGRYTWYVNAVIVKHTVMPNVVRIRGALLRSRRGIDTGRTRAASRARSKAGVSATFARTYSPIGPMRPPTRKGMRQPN